MTIYLDEDCVGEDPNEIAYPHLLLCMGVTCQLQNGRLIGAHITNDSTEQTVLKEMKRRIDSDPSKPVALYITGHLINHWNNKGGSPEAKAKQLGYRGDVYGYDTARLNPTDGSFVKINSQAVNIPANMKASIVAIRDEDARPYDFKSPPATPSGSMVKFSPGNPTPQPPRIFKTGVAANTILPNPLALNQFTVIRVT